MSIIYQDYGTSILLFIKGYDEKAAYGKWLSLYNWNATSTEANFVAPNTIACWSTARKFLRYLFTLHKNALEDNCPKNMRGDMDIAVLAAQRARTEFEDTTRESFRSINSEITPFAMGEVSAEKPDADFADTVLAHAFAYRE